MGDLNIKFLRKSLNLKQKDFCEKTGIAQSYLSELERNVKPMTEEVYNKILKAFGEELIKENQSDKVSDISDIDGIKGKEQKNKEYEYEFILYLKNKISELEQKNSKLENENGYLKGLLDKNNIDYKK